MKAGNSITVDTGNSGANRTVSWSGCVLERRTSPFNATSTAPSTALDMDVDLVPSDENSRWRMLIPELSYHRASTIGTVPSGTGVQTVASGNVSGSNWQSYEYYGSSGYGVCPAEAFKLTELDTGDRAWFKGKIDGLQPVGGTYHDAGMVWGVQMSISQDFTLAPAHAHNNLIGFVTMVIYGFYYRLVPAAAARTLATVHFWVALIGALTFGPGIAVAVTQKNEMLVQVATLFVLAAMVIFVWTVWSNRKGLTNA